MIKDTDHDVFRFTNRSGAPASGIVAWFDRELGEVVSVRVGWLGSPDRVRRHVEGNVLTVEWPDEIVSENQFIDLHVRVASGHPRPIAREWIECRADRSAVWNLTDPIPFEGPPTWVRLDEDEPTLQSPGRIKRYRRFFDEFEINTNVDLYALDDFRTYTDRVDDHERNYRAAAVRNALLDLDARLRARLGAKPQPLRLAGGHVEHLAMLQLRVIEGHFRNGAGDFDSDDFEAAVEAFANGELMRRSLPLNCEPDGHRFFFFAEYAFLALESGAGPAERWKEIVPAWVRSTEVFRITYGPGLETGTLAPTFGSYGPSERPDDWFVPADGLQRIREEFAAERQAPSFSLSDAFTKRAHRTFAGEITRS